MCAAIEDISRIKMRVECSNVIVHIFVCSILLQCTMMELMTDTLIECASNKDFTFKLLKSKLNTSRTIAECHVEDKSCFMLTKTHSNKYNVTYTGHCGLLKIRVLDNSTIGTYQCFDTVDQKNTVSTNIAPSDNILTIENCAENSQEASGADQTDTTGHIVLGTLQNASIECSSNVALTFSFLSNTSNTHVTIAECDFRTKACYMFSTSLQNKYSLQYTGCGGVMQIISLDNDTIGEYTCFDTLDPKNNISFGISFPFTDTVVYTTYNVTESTESTGVLENDWKEIGAQIYMIFGIGSGVILGMGIMAFFFKKKLKLFLASMTTKASAKKKTDSSVELMSMENDAAQGPSGKETNLLC